MNLITPMPEPVISARNLNHYFGEGNLRKQVLFDIDLDIYGGEIVIMTGPSGSGKTTLLTLMGGLRSAQEGSLRMLKQELRDASKQQLTKLRRSIEVAQKTDEIIKLDIDGFLPNALTNSRSRITFLVSGC